VEIPIDDGKAKTGGTVIGIPASEPVISAGVGSGARPKLARFAWHMV
jgi:hypothetical protein